MVGLSIGIHGAGVGAGAGVCAGAGVVPAPDLCVIAINDSVV